MKGGIPRKGLIAHWQNSDVSSQIFVVSTFLCFVVVYVFCHLYFVLQNSDVLLAVVGVLCQPSHTSTCSLLTVKCTTRMTTHGARHARNVATQQLTRKCKLYSYLDHVVNFGTFTLYLGILCCSMQIYISFYCFFDACAWLFCLEGYSYTDACILCSIIGVIDTLLH